MGIWRLALLACLVLSCRALGTARRPPLERPNIVLMVVDDMGWGDLERPGLALPHLERMAAEGRRFQSFYVPQAAGSASRAALLFGAYPNRLGFTGALSDEGFSGLPPGAISLAQMCAGRGYRSALVGQWPLGEGPGQGPLEHGFDEYVGLNVHRGDPGASAGIPLDRRNSTEAVTRELTDRALAFIERQGASGQPFFLMLAQPMPRAPLQASPAFHGASGTGLYGDVLLELDQSVGRVRAALERGGLLRNTLLIFTSSNGPGLSYGDHAGSTGGLRGGKGSSFEGGVRVPCIMSWPGVIQSASLCERALMSIDLLPSLAAWVGADLAAGGIDGHELGALLRGVQVAQANEHPYGFWSRAGKLEALRLGRWKLHLPHRFRTLPAGYAGRGGTPGRYRYGQRLALSLFDLALDPGEQEDVSKAYPEVLTKLIVLAEGMAAGGRRAP